MTAGAASAPTFCRSTIGNVTHYHNITFIQRVCYCGIVVFTASLLLYQTLGFPPSTKGIGVSPPLRSGNANVLLNGDSVTPGSSIHDLLNTPKSHSLALTESSPSGGAGLVLDTTTFTSSVATDRNQASSTHILTNEEGQELAQEEKLAQEDQGSSSRLDYDELDFKSSTPNAPKCDPIEPKDIDFTLVTQLTPARLWIMKHHCKLWGDHPISIAVGTKISSKVILAALRVLGCNTDYVKVSTVGDFDSEEDYPVNRLRNMALAGVQTSHAVLLDADFVLSTNAYEHLMKQCETLAADHKTALVVPVFELHSLCDASEDPDCKMIHEGMLPKTKAELLDIYTSPALDATIAQFDVKGNANGHGSTRYMNWISQKTDTLLPIECITSPRYEPYLAFRYCQDLPPFQEAFTGYGQNKLTWFQQVRRNGYRLFQLGDVFATHFPHAKSSAFRIWTQERNDLGQVNKSMVKVNRIADSFRRWMEDHVPNNSVLPQC